MFNIVALGLVVGLYSDIMKTVGASERVFQLLDRKPNVNWKGGIIPREIKGDIKLEDVHFFYPSRPDVEVLQGIKFQSS